MHSIVFLDRDSLPANVRRPAFAHDWREHPNTARADVAERLQGATIAIVNKVKVDAEALAQLPDLKMIAIAATGTDNVDLAECSRRGIVVSNIRDYALAAVPEHVFALLLALRRNLVGYRADMEAGSWPKSDRFCAITRPIRDLAGSTIGLIGFGALGRAVADLALAFGMKVIVHNRSIKPDPAIEFVSLDELLARADVVSLHVMQTPDTRGLMGREQFARMKPGALLINTARGGLVDEAALAEALQSGHLGGAGLDVLSVEPPPADHPLLQLRLPNLIVTPHVGWASAEAMQGLADQLIDNIEAWEAGRPRNLVAC
ncbi:D-2-hydroxyacid dehydrogenase [Derxia gummosa]|uniref:D-2-hydroxyacid dehydrogenase n=1 Tax=Derxia gummosa DSM 723 TaxID=1121388 RepID=A0A8B6X5W4_9BURK|nr:D-2-hydroxyacid dehydrogenase [Derxia gummosa]